MKKIKKKLTKRGLALFLVLAMCLGQVNMAAFAAEDVNNTADVIASDTGTETPVVETEKTEETEAATKTDESEAATEAEESEESTEAEDAEETAQPAAPTEAEDPTESTETEGTEETDGPEDPTEAEDIVGTDEPEDPTKAEDIVETNEPEDPTKAEESTAALESTAAEGTTGAEDPTSATETTEAEEPTAAAETTEAEESAEAEDPTSATETAEAEESTEAEEPTAAAETTEAEESTEATETTAAKETEPVKVTVADEVPESVKAFLDAVKALEEAIKAEDAEEALVCMEICEETFDALSEEDMEREDVTEAIARMAEMMGNAATLATTYPIQYTESGITYNLNEDGTATVKKGSPTDGIIDIPAVISYEDAEYKVTAIGNQAFYTKDGYYAEVTLPDSLESIGEYAFMNVFLTNEELRIPNTVITIAKQAFCYFNNGEAHVTKIILGSNVETIGQNAFYTSNTTNKVEVECWTNITSCASSAFCSGGVFSVLVHGSKDSMASVFSSVPAFYGLIMYTQGDTTYSENKIIYNLNEDGTATVKSGSPSKGKIEIPASVTYDDTEYEVTAIANQAFYTKNGYYAEVTLPEGLEVIGEWAFRNVRLKNEELRIPDTVTAINQQAFCYFNDGEDGAYVTKIILGSNVEIIGEYAFYTSNTTDKVEVECGTKITSCPNSAFWPGSIFSVLVHGPKDSMTSVFSGVAAFYGLIMYTQGDTTYSENKIIYNLNEDGTATVKKGSPSKGKIEIPASVTYNGTEYKVTAIADQAFYTAGGYYAEVTLPDGLEVIGEYAFMNVFLKNTELCIPNTVTTIKKQAFYFFNNGDNGAYVTKIILGSNVETIGEYAFYTTKTTKKVKVECGTSITSCDSNAFCPDSVSSVLVNGPKYSMTPVFGNVSAFSGLIKYTQEGTITIDTNNIDCLETLRGAIEQADGPTELILTNDISSMSSIVIPEGKDITIKDNGSEKCIEATSYPVFKVDAGGKLTLDGTNGAGAPNLRISPGYSAEGIASGVANAVQVEGEFVLNNADINGSSTIISGRPMTRGLVVVNNGGKFTMNGGIIHNMSADYVGLAAAVVVTPGSEFDMSGGSIENNKVYFASSYAAGGVLLYTWNKNDTPAKMTLSGNARIADNTNSGGGGGAGGGGITLVGDVELIMNGGIITNNTAGSDRNHAGGGICVAGPTGAMSADYDVECKFTMDGGKITNNKTEYGYGGGIYINSNYVTLNAGEISGNEAYVSGGGIYVETPRAGKQTGAKVNSAVIYGNTASIMGGGLYFCPTGFVDLNAYQGVGIFDNEASGTKAAGDDFVFIGYVDDPRGYRPEGVYATLAGRMLGGGKVDWYNDGKVHENVAGFWGYVTEDSVRYKDEEKHTLVTPDSYEKDLALKAVVTEGAKELARKQAKLFITGNKAQRGGGIGSNGEIVAGWVDPKEWNIVVDAKKIWKDIPQDQWEPVTFQLKIDGKVVETVTLSAENDWKCEFTGLPTSAFKTIEIEEVTQGYAVSILKKTESGVVTGLEGVDVQQGEEKVEFTKNDKEDEISFKFYRKGDNLIIALDKNSDAEDTYTFIIDGPEEVAGKTYNLIYSNAADELIQVVNPALNNNASGELLQIATYSLNNNTAGELPKTVTFGTSSEATITVKGGSSVTIVGVPQGQYIATKGNVSFEVTNSPAGNLVISKKIVVEGPENPDVLGREFSFIVEGPASKDYDGVKIVEGDLADSDSDDIKTVEGVKLSFTSEKGSNIATATITITGDNSVTICNLPLGEYTVKEEEASVDGYKWSYTVSDNDKVTVNKDETSKFTITNTYIPTTTSLTVNKVWANDGGIDRPASVTVQLYGNGSPEGDPVTLSAADGWSRTWDNLDNIDGEGNKIVWTVQEIKIPDDYTATINYSENGTTATITNTYVPDDQPAVTSLTVNKVWANVNGMEHPANVTVQLYRNDTAEGSPVTLSADNNWSRAWGSLDKTDAEGKEIAWSVREIVPDGYTATYAKNGTTVTITNTYIPDDQPATTSLTVNKVWADDEGVSRPASVTVQLYRNDTAEGSSVTLSADNSWGYTWNNLDKTDAEGKEITWSVSEIEVPGYAASYATDGTVVTITNTYRPNIPDRPTPGNPGEPGGETPGNPPPTPPEPEVEISENPTPLASRETEFEIPDEDIPLAGLPKTGDISLMWYIMSVISAFGLMLLKLKKREDEI